jgi:hypothetical protein
MLMMRDVGLMFLVLFSDVCVYGVLLWAFFAV